MHNIAMLVDVICIGLYPYGINNTVISHAWSIPVVIINFVNLHGVFLSLQYSPMYNT